MKNMQWKIEDNGSGWARDMSTGLGHNKIKALYSTAYISQIDSSSWLACWFHA